MKRILNVKLVLLFLGSTVVLGAGVHLLHGFQVKRNAGALLAQAGRDENEGRLDRAEDGLGRYLLYRPDDVEALVKYARVVEKLDKTAEGRGRAFRAYEKAVRLDAGRSDVRRRLADMAIEDGQFSVAKTHLEVLSGASPKDGELTYLLGRCEEDAGRFREAAELYETARRQDPSRVEVYARLADLLRVRLSDPDRADAVMDARKEKGGLIAHNARSASAYLARAAYRRRYAVPGADPSADVARALELAPDDAAVLLAAAASARDGRDLKAARGLLERGLRSNDKNAAMYQGLAQLEARAGRFDEAVAWLKKGIAALPESEQATKGGLKWSLVNLLVDAGQGEPARLKEAEDYIDGLGKDENARVRPGLLDYLRARVLVSRGDWSGASRALEGVHAALAADPDLKEPTKRSLVLLGQCYYRLGNDERCVDAYRKAVAIDLDPDPLWAPARTGLAAALVKLNRFREAEGQYRILMTREPAAGIGLARLQVVENLRRPAEEQARGWDEVVRTLDAVERGPGATADPAAAAEAAVLRSEVLAVRRQFGPARRVLENALEKYPDRVDLRIALAFLAGREGKPEATLDALDAAEKRLGDRTELRVARVGYWALRGGPGAVEALKNVEKGAGSLPAPDRTRLSRELAAAYARLGQGERALRLWQQVAKEDPNNLDVRVNIFNLALESGDRAATDAALAEVRRVEGEDGSFWRLAAAVRQIRLARQAPRDPAPLAEARGLLEQVAARRPAWPRAALAQAQVEELGGNPDGAIRSYLKAILELGARDEDAVGRVLQLLVTRRRLSEATQLVQKLREEKNPLTGDLQRLVADVSARAGDTGRALELAEKSVPGDSKNPSELAWLGMIQWAAGRDAEPAFRRAVSLAGTDPGIRLTLIRYLAQAGRKGDAEAALVDAERALTGPAATLALAQAHEALGHPERAGELYRKALAARPDDPTTLRAVASHHLRAGRPAEAVPLLERVIKLGGTTADASLARRLLAMLTAAGGGRRNAVKALEVLGLAEAGTGSDKPSDSTDPEDLRTRARILAIQPSRAQRREAVSLLRGLIDRRVGTPADLALLAQLLTADGDWQEGQTRYLEALKAEPKNPTYLSSYVLALLQHGRTDEARTYLGKLEQLAPGQPAVVELKARVLAAAGKKGEAASALDALTRGNDERLADVARLLEELGLTADAERTYRRYAEVFRRSRPEADLALAGFLGRQGRTREALDALDPAWATCPPERTAAAAVLALYGAKSDDPAQTLRVSDRLAAAIRKDPEKSSLRFVMANVEILQGRYDDAQKTFREIYERDKTVGSPLNNMAWMLALRDGKGREALELVQKAIGLEGERPELLDTRSLAYLATGQADAAVQDLQNALSVRPSPDLYFHLARAHLAKGQPAEAVQALRKAQALGMTAQTLHPLERATYNQLVADLAKP